MKNIIIFLSCLVGFTGASGSNMASNNKSPNIRGVNAVVGVAKKHNLTKGDVAHLLEVIEVGQKPAPKTPTTTK